MKMRKRYLLMALVLVTAAGCATVPAGPSVAVMPAPGKPFDLFQREDAQCRQYAQQQIGVSPQDTVNKSTAAGAAIGGATGAALGSLSYSGGSGVAFGALTGALFGAAVGSSQGQYYGYEAQRRYDIAYQQCMFANGNMVPGVRRVYRSTPPPPPPDMHSSASGGAEPGYAPPPPPAP